MEHTKKQRLSSGDKLLKQKVQKLPLLCVEAILKFAPTSKLIRLYSNAVPLPGAFWNFRLGAVLKMRLPLFLVDNVYHPADGPAIFDANGARVASVKRPEAFGLSPLCELVESATLMGRILPSHGGSEERKPHVVHGESLLSPLQLTELKLSFRSNFYGTTERMCAEGRDLLRPSLDLSLATLQSLSLVSWECVSSQAAWLEASLSDFVRELPIHEMTSLRHLTMHESVFTSLRQLINTNDPALFARLDSLVLCEGSREGSSELRAFVSARHDILRFLSANCVQLTALALPVYGDFRPFLAAFRELRNLTMLGLNLYWVDLNGLKLCKESAIGSVMDLRFLCSDTTSPDSELFVVASWFPNAKAVAFESRCGSQYASQAEAFCAKRVLPALEKLSCFSLFDSIVYIAEFIACASVPETVDFSQINCRCLERDADLLTVIYRAMQSNDAKTLLLRGPVHCEALLRLQRHLDLTGEDAEVTAWKDRDLGDQRGLFGDNLILEQTDVKIVGRKTAADGKFSIRVFHQLAKRRRIFEF